MSKVYVLTAGCYSDYHIVGIFSSKDTARLFKEKYNRRYIREDGWQAKIEDWEMDILLDKKGMTYFSVSMREDGRVLSVEESDFDNDSAWEYNHHWYNENPTYCSLDANIWARDKEHAIKIVNDARAVILSENMWQDGKEGWEEKDRFLERFKS